LRLVEHEPQRWCATIKHIQGSKAAGKAATVQLDGGVHLTALHAGTGFDQGLVNAHLQEKTPPSFEQWGFSKFRPRAYTLRCGLSSFSEIRRL
jgi:hypothetical protein